jgi:general secretion pathway protein G
VRRDKNLVPINTDFDLYSVGKDGVTVSPLTAAQSRDDVVRANDGTFIGLGEDY